MYLEALSTSSELDVKALAAKTMLIIPVAKIYHLCGESTWAAAAAV